jgi:hypothetical protein
LAITLKIEYVVPREVVRIAQCMASHEIGPWEMLARRQRHCDATQGDVIHGHQSRQYLQQQVAPGVVWAMVKA